MFNMAKMHVRLLDTLEYLKIIIFSLKKYAFLKIAFSALTC